MNTDPRRNTLTSIISSVVKNMAWLDDRNSEIQVTNWKRKHRKSLTVYYIITR
jgi:hypothetical protein